MQSRTESRLISNMSSQAQAVSGEAVGAQANRWGIAVAGVFLQLALGAVYAWSVFRVPLAKQFGWSIPEVTLTFTIAIFALGFASFFAGLWVRRSKPGSGGLFGCFYF